MKKIIGLSIPIGMVAILVMMILLWTSATQASLINEIIAVDKNGSTEGEPQWFDFAWNYRRPVVITNTGATLSWYQVLVRLDSNNFNFNQAKSDGSDVRFTHTDGTTELEYWIESWDSVNQEAYLWVKVPYVDSGTMRIFIYFNNPEATSVSDGTSTFDNFDDEWSQYIGTGLNWGDGAKLAHFPEDINSPFIWTTIGGTPQALEGILYLSDGDGIKSNSTYLPADVGYALGMRANFGLGTGREWGGFIDGATGQRTMIGDLPSDIDDLYLIDYRSNYDTVMFSRDEGNDWHNYYHVYEVRWTENQCVGDIDHGLSTVNSNLPSQIPDNSLPVTLYSYAASDAIMMVDWAYVRQYREPEPTVGVSTEQGLVDLAIDQADSPDPIRPGAKLTYQLTISNTSIIDAPGVIVTDTLPADVQLASISPSQGSCQGDSVILCNLDVINADSTAGITIIVTPTVGGVITNTVDVASPGYEINTGDDSDEEVTLVDSEPPVVNWEKPAQNGQLYYAFGNPITLEASAIDNDQVGWVEFRLWDHNHHVWVSVGKDTSYPYQVPFDSSTLEVNQTYQMFVVGVDRVGNESDPTNPLQRIFIERKLPVYLPMMKK